MPSQILRTGQVYSNTSSDHFSHLQVLVIQILPEPEQNPSPLLYPPMDVSSMSLSEISELIILTHVLNYLYP